MANYLFPVDDKNVNLIMNYASKTRCTHTCSSNVIQRSRSNINAFTSCTVTHSRYIIAKT